jgi:hypothetical protein
MPRFSQRCTSCAWADDIIVKPFEMPPCPACGEATERYYPIGGTTGGVIVDEWPGGQTFHNLGHEPVTLYSRTELRREMAARGLEHRVRHVGVPGSDRSPETTRWI